MADERRVRQLQAAIRETERELRQLTQREARALVALGVVTPSMSVADHHAAAKAIAHRAEQRTPAIVRLSGELIRLEAQLAALA